MNESTQETHELSQQANAIAGLPPELALMRMDNDSIMTLAAARPRDHKTILANINSQLEAYPSFAKDAIYNKPVGKDKDGIMKYARGLSVRAAEAVAEAYGYCRVQAGVDPVDKDTVKITATFVDYQQGRIWADTAIVSKFYTNNRGAVTRHKEDRFWNIVVKAEKSKLIREVILRSVPPGLRTELEGTAERKIAELLDDNEIKRILDSFNKMGVTMQQLEGVIGRTFKSGWTKTDRLTLLGIFNAIEQNESSIEEVFGSNGDKSQAPKKSTNGASAEDLAGPKNEKSNETEEPEKSAFELFQSNMEKAESADALDAVKHEASMEAQQGSLTMDEWKQLQAIHKKLKESFVEKTS